MPFADPDRVIRIFGSTPQYKQDDLSYADYLDLREQMQTVSGLATIERVGTVLVQGDETEDLRADIVSRNFFSVMGIQAHLGRFFSESDEPALKNTDTVVLSHRLWQRRFGGDPNLVGRSIVLSHRTLVVLAIASVDFNGLERLNPAEVWYPFENYRDIGTSWEQRSLGVVGRLKSGYTVAQAQTEAETIFRRLDFRDAASRAPLRALVQTEARVQFERTGTLGLLLLGIVGTVLLLACTNVSSMLLARAEVRAREMAVRSALGCGRWRLVRQLLAESLVLSLIAMAVSLLLASWLVSVWPALLPPSAASAIALVVHFDGRAVAFTTAISLLTIVLFGLAPALYASRPDLVAVLKGSSAGGRGAGRRGLSALVVGQTTVALVLMVMAALLTRSLLAYYTADIGFERKEILLVSLNAGNEEQGRILRRQLKERVLALPGVKRVSVARVVPFSLSGLGASKKIFPLNRATSAPQDGWSVKFNAIDPEYFGLLGMSVLRGRDFNERDDKSSARVMLINETMADKFWPNEDPVGQLVRLGSLTGEAVQIIGVVGDTRIVNIDEEAQPYLFLSLAQYYHWEMILMVESAVKAAALAGPVRAELSQLGINPSQSDISTMKEYIRFRLSGEEFLAKATVTFGLLDLFLASLGLYGVLNYTVSRRTRGIGIRIALGAPRREVLALVLRRGMMMATLGAGLGFPIALAAGHALRGLLYAVSPLDPLSITVSLAIVLAVALLACYIPARRAAKIDPMEALRYE